jgi:hypothetical protein
MFCVVAQVFLAVPAEDASPASNKGVDPDSLAEQVRFGFIEDFLDNTCKLVTKDNVRRVVDMTPEGLLAPGIFAVEVTHITAADAAFGDLN